MYKITQKDIDNSDTDIFGEWINKTPELKEEFIGNQPFPHILIKNFLQDHVIEKIYQELPEFNTDNSWFYNNPIEVKFAKDNLIDLHPVVQNVFYALSHPKIVDKIESLTGVKDLEYDPLLHGGGLHGHPKNGRLLMHLDYEKHPILENKQRRLNIILYLNKDWNKEWNGATELWDKNMENKIKEYNVIFNNALIFQTNEDSWHGVPEKITCPDDVLRKTLAYYYVSPLINEDNENKIGAGDSGFREKACFTMRPTDIQDPRILKLLSIRPIRRITEDDMNEIYPEWNINT